MNSRNLLLIVALILAGVGGLYWTLTKPSAPAARPEPTPLQTKTVVKTEQPIAALPPRPESVQPKAQKPAAEPAAAQEPIYETQIDQVLRSNIGETQTAKVLINMLPTMPEEGQVQAAQHIANLLPDSDYQSVLPTLLNPNTPESVSSVLFTDLMNRSDGTKLNAFLQIAQVPNHPNQEESMSDLQIFLDHDYGTDWPKWKTAIAEYLAKQAAEQ